MATRKIKFRAWIPALNKIVYIGSETNDTAVWIEETGFDVVEHFTGSPVSLGTDKTGCELMQFIGLKDKNRKEIYEDDIVKNPQGGTFLVEWSDKGACWQLLGWNEKDLEVIGNLHENPELLK